MSYVTSSILSRIYSKNENIKGILSNLEVIMDSSSYQEIYKEYLKISNKIPTNEKLTEFEEKYENFGSDLRYMSLEKELTILQNKLEIYNEYKELYDLVNIVNNNTSIIFNKSITLEEYIEESIKLIDKLIIIKNNKTIHQFTNLLNNAIETIFNTLKITSLINNNELIDYINKLESNYLNEHLASKVRKSINTTLYKGDLDTDYLTFDVLYKCASNDNILMIKKNEAIALEENERKRIEEEKIHLSNLLNDIKQNEFTIKKYTDLKNSIKVSNISIRTKKILLKLITIPTLIIPLACPFIGNNLGKKASSNVMLTKTITKTVDANSLDVISKNEAYEELKTTYVASVTICEPWKKNLSGVSYSRNCTVYDYKIDNVNVDEFNLTLDTINQENLVKKYTYEEVSSNVLDDKYLNDYQIYITETYQDLNDVKTSKKYNLPYTIAGIGTGIVIGTTEFLAYILIVKDLLENIHNDLNYKLEENKSNLLIFNNELNSAIKRKELSQNEYKTLSRRKL